jgi:hypothetical protein
MVRGDSYAELETKEAQHLARQHCLTVGFQARGLSNIPVTHPINEAGETTDAVCTGQETVAGYAKIFQFGAGG